MENFHLPQDIVLNILLRLPLISFLRFRCVCKAWYSLLSDPIFMYKNLTFINSDDDLQLLIKRRRDITCHNYFSLISFHNLHYNISPSKRYLPFAKGIKYDDSITVVGCCNGFVCLTNNTTKILVWNPLTKGTKVLPESPYYHDYDYFDFQLFEVGFYFDDEANDYKVIKIFHPEEQTLCANVVYLYSFRSNCWKKIDFSLRLTNFYPSPINSDGIFCHWLAEIDIPCTTEEVFRDDLTIPSVILSFNMKLELFKTTEIPYIKYYWKGHPFVGIGFFMLKEYVSIFATPLESDEAGAPIFEISVLMRIGVKESWIKLISIGPVAGAQKMLRPWKNGNLFLQTCKGDVMVYDPFTREVVNLLPSNGIPSSHLIQIITYKRTHVQLGAINIG